MQIIDLIEEKRAELNNAVQQESTLTNHTVLRISRELDLLINKFNKIGRGTN